MNAANRQHVGGSEEMPVSVLDHRPTPSDVRLVDGPSPLSGRLQIYHAGHWRSVCTNSRKSVPFSFFFLIWLMLNYNFVRVSVGRWQITRRRAVRWVSRVAATSSGWTAWIRLQVGHFYLRIRAVSRALPVSCNAANGNRENSVLASVVSWTSSHFLAFSSVCNLSIE